MDSAERLKRLREYYRETVVSARRAADHLASSFSRVGSEEAVPRLAGTADGMDRLESLTSRFARLADILTQQAFRLRDQVEHLEEGSLIDRLHRAEKRGWIDSASQWEAIRTLRNRISHEYADEAWIGIVLEAFRLTPILLDCMDRVAASASENAPSPLPE